MMKERVSAYLAETRQIDTFNYITIVYCYPGWLHSDKFRR